MKINNYSFWGKLLYIDKPTRVWLRTPGNPNKCRGNGTHKNILGRTLPCCCDECDYGEECYHNETKANTD